jgi:AcrR family transcriptional regulator
MSWSIRHLASRLGVAPSVIYHHVGGKDLLCQGVVERILELIELPSAELPWDEWFRDLLRAIGPLAAEYPGTAKWMLLHGPTLPAALPVLESGLSALHSAGFGDRADTAYAALFNNAMLTVSIGDDRLQHEGDGPRDHFAMMSNFRDMPLSTQARAMGEQFIHPFAEGGETAARMRWDYYRVIVDVTISGVRTLLGPRQKP